MSVIRQKGRMTPKIKGLCGKYKGFIQDKITVISYTLQMNS